MVGLAVLPRCANPDCRLVITPAHYGVRFHGEAMCCCEACALAVAALEAKRHRVRDNYPCTVKDCQEPRYPGQTRCKRHFREAQCRSEARRRELREERRAAA